jgi:hypothetical protein
MDDRHLVQRITVRPVTTEDRAKVLLALPLDVYEALRTVVTWWWLDLKDIINTRD